MNMPAPDVARYADSDTAAIGRLLARFGLEVLPSAEGEEIPGSYWGDEEAGLLGNRVRVRSDTPLHSLLHEACHYICMDPQRRAELDTDAGGSYDEENGVCYLQILLAEEIPGFGSERMMQDMDRWGYTFRLGSARAWFKNDAEDARSWLQHHDLVDQAGQPTYRLKTGVRAAGSL